MTNNIINFLVIIIMNGNANTVIIINIIMIVNNIAYIRFIINISIHDNFFVNFINLISVHITPHNIRNT